MKNFVKIMFLISIYLVIFTTSTYAGFTDVEEHWCSGEIIDFEKSGFVEGYEDNTFRPDNEITRAEFCKIINSYMGYEVSGDWEVANMDMAAEKGYLTVGDARDYISREEAFVVLAKVMSVEDVEGYELKYLDVDAVSPWALHAVRGLTYNSYLVGYEDNELKPKCNLTRAELVKILYNYVGVGGLDEDVEDVTFSIGYMTHNEYGLEFVEVVDVLNAKCDDIYMLASTVAEEDGETVFEVISGEELVEFDSEIDVIELMAAGEVKVKGTTTKSNKEIVITIIVE